MEKKKLNKLMLKKEVISTLSNEEQKHVVGGWTTSFDGCSGGMFCCEAYSGLTVSIPKSCVGTNCDCDYGSLGGYC